jgi:hypothetical protein
VRLPRTPKRLTPALQAKAAAWYELLKDVDAYLRPVPVATVPKPTNLAPPPSGGAFVASGRIGKWLKLLPPEQYDQAIQWLLGKTPLMAVTDPALMFFPRPAEVEVFRKEYTAPSEAPRRRIAGHVMDTPEGWVAWADLLAVMESSPHAAYFKGLVEKLPGHKRLDDLWANASRLEPSRWGEGPRALVWLAEKMQGGLDAPKRDT